MFDPIHVLLLGFVTGVLFGFLLQKGQVTKFRVIVGQFLLRDFTMLKIVLTAILVGGVGVHVLIGFGAASFHIKPMIWGGVVTGGVLFGVGMVLLGYCPGTGVAAMAEGSRHAVFGVLGMLLGAALFAECYPWLAATLLTVGDAGKVTLPDVTGVPAGALLLLLSAVVVPLFWALEQWEQRRVSAERPPLRPAPGARTSAAQSPPQPTPREHVTDSKT